MKLRLALLLVALGLVLVVAVPVALGALTVTRAELKSGQLRVEGQGAIPGTPISIDGVVHGTAASDGTFRIELTNFPTPVNCTITVSDGRTSTQAKLAGCSTTTQPPPATGPPGVTGLSLSSKKVVGGTTAMGTIFLNGAPDACCPLTVLVSNDVFNPAFVQTPSSVTISAPSASGVFPIVTGPITFTMTVNLAVGTSTSFASASFFLVPTAQTDIITITRADLSQNGDLTIEAQSDSLPSTMTAKITFSGTIDLGPLENAGGGRFKGSFKVPFGDGVVTVRSDLGGCAFKSVNRLTASGHC